MSILHELSALVTVRNYIRMMGDTNHPLTKEFVRKSQAIDQKIFSIINTWDISKLTLVGDLNGNSPHDDILESLLDIKDEITQLNRALIPTKTTTFSSTDADFDKSVEMVEAAQEPTEAATETPAVEAPVEVPEAAAETVEAAVEAEPAKESKRNMKKKPLPTVEELDAMLESGNITYKPRSQPPAARPDPLPSPIRADLPTKKPIKNGFKKI